MEKRYTVRQAVTLTGVKSYVLRYWEEELELRIGRNELGHRYYTPFDIQLFLKINELKSKGLQLKAIRTLIPPEARKADTPDFSESVGSGVRQTGDFSHSAEESCGYHGFPDTLRCRLRQCPCEHTGHR